MPRNTQQATTQSHLSGSKVQMPSPCPPPLFIRDRPKRRLFLFKAVGHLQRQATPEQSRILRNGRGPAWAPGWLPCPALPRTPQAGSPPLQHPLSHPKLLVWFPAPAKPTSSASVAGHRHSSQEPSVSRVRQAEWDRRPGRRARMWHQRISWGHTAQASTPCSPPTQSVTSADPPPLSKPQFPALGNGLHAQSAHGLVCRTPAQELLLTHDEG